MGRRCGSAAGSAPDDVDLQDAAAGHQSQAKVRVAGASSSVGAQGATRCRRAVVIATHRLRIRHAQTYRRFSLLSILNVVILGVRAESFYACRNTP